MSRLRDGVVRGSTGKSAYEELYLLSEHQPLWGDKPGRLISRLPLAAAPMTVLDAGCGDGKNALYLEQLGYKVTGFDCSESALALLHRRFSLAQAPVGGWYECLDAEEGCEALGADFDILVSYGLFHCLEPSRRHIVHRRLQEMVALGGSALFTALTDDIPLPSDHLTPGVVLPTVVECRALFEDGWTVRAIEEGHLAETHEPAVGYHEHSAVWIEAQRIS